MSTTTQGTQYVTVTMQMLMWVHASEHQPNSHMLYAGDIYRCPVDEAYTLVSTGKASYPDGVEKLKELLYREPVSGRLERLEAGLASPDLQAALSMGKKLEGAQRLVGAVTNFVKTAWDIKGAIVILAGLLGAAYLMVQSHFWPGLPVLSKPMGVHAPVASR